MNEEEVNKIIHSSYGSIINILNSFPDTNVKFDSNSQNIFIDGINVINVKKIESSIDFESILKCIDFSHFDLPVFEYLEVIVIILLYKSQMRLPSFNFLEKNNYFNKLLCLIETDVSDISLSFLNSSMIFNSSRKLSLIHYSQFFSLCLSKCNIDYIFSSIYVFFCESLMKPLLFLTENSNNNDNNKVLNYQLRELLSILNVFFFF
jgi:hypothetical protein